MTRRLLYMMSGVALASLPVSMVEARPVAHRAVAVHRHHRGPYFRNAQVQYRNPYPVDPRYGYEEAPYDPSYHGPGAEVFRRTLQSAREPGVTRELDPFAKQTATGGPSGGLPSQSGGGAR